jgi:putative endonuclease
MKIVNSVGKFGENKAAEFLMEKGYRIIEMNFRKNYTEIDIIAQKNGLLVFVEVKTRVSDSFGKPFEAITKQKINNLVKTAQLYANFHPNLPKSLRIDAIGVTVDKDGRIENIEHVENISGF